MYPPNPDFIRIVPTQTALFSGEIVMGAGDLAVVGLPIPALRPETAVLIELRAED